MKKSILLALSISLIFSVQSCKTSSGATVADAQVKATHGEAFTAKKVMTYDELLAKMESDDKVDNVVVEGKVAGVCQAKGCWMNMVSAKSDSSQEMFVKFKDYAFFMPKDLGGGTVVMKGNAFKETTSVEELRHYAEDEGKSPEDIAKITEPKVELKFMASGVKILN